eukprot:Opistho-2@25726
MVARELLLFEKLHRQLPQRINSKHSDVEIREAADLVEVLSNDGPDARPLETNATHVVVAYFDNLLEAEHPRVLGALQLVERHGAQPPHKLLNRIAAESNRPREYAVDGHHDRLRRRLAHRVLQRLQAFAVCATHARFAVPRQSARRSLPHGHAGRHRRAHRPLRAHRTNTTLAAATHRAGRHARPGCIGPRAAATVGLHEGRVALRARANQLGHLQLRNALEHVVPRALQVVALRVRNRNEALDRLNVLRLHVCGTAAAAQARELGKRLDVCIALQLHVEDGADPDGALEAVEAECDHRGILRVLERDAERSQRRRPRDLEHRSDVLNASRSRESRCPRAVLQLRLRRLQHHLHLLRVNLLPLLLIRKLRNGRLVHCFLSAHLNTPIRNLVIDGLEVFERKIFRVVDAAVVAHKLALCHLLLNLRIVEVRRQHNDRIGKNVRRVRIRKNAVARIVGNVALCKLLHEAIDLLRLAGKTEPLEKPPQRLHERQARKVEQVDVRIHDVNRVLVALAKKLANLSFAQAVVGMEEFGDVFRARAEDAVLLKVLDALGRLLVEAHKAAHENLLLLLKLLQLLREVRLGRRRHCARICHRRTLRIGIECRLLRGVLSKHCRQLGPFGGLHLVAPDNHRPQNVHEALEALGLHALLLRGRPSKLRRLPPLRNAAEVVHQTLKYVLHVQVAVVVDEQVNNRLRIGAHLAKCLHHHPLVLKRARCRLENVQENVLEKHLNLRLQVALVERDEREEDGEGQLKHTRNGRHAVLRQRQAEILLDCVHKRVGCLEHRPAVLQNGQKELEGEHLTAQLVRL